MTGKPMVHPRGGRKIFQSALKNDLTSFRRIKMERNLPEKALKVIKIGKQFVDSDVWENYQAPLDWHTYGLKRTSVVLKEWPDI